MRGTRAKAMLIGFTVLLAGRSYANQEITADLPGGATMEMVWIEPGTFMMGSPDSELGRRDDEGPQHQVTLTRGFYLGKYELTQEQWQAVMGTTPWSGRAAVREKPNYPAVYISGKDMQEFVDKLNQAAGDSLYRLPTEAEWEYAGRAGTTTAWSFGDGLLQLSTLLNNYAWCEVNNGGRAQAVGTKLPNPWGLFDMHGNVWEWLQDGHEPVAYSSSSQTDPQGSASGVARGGAWHNEPRFTRSAVRFVGKPVLRDRFSDTGARLVRMAPASPTAVVPQSWGQLKKDAR